MNTQEIKAVITEAKELITNTTLPMDRRKKLHSVAKSIIEASPNKRSELAGTLHLLITTIHNEELAKLDIAEPMALPVIAKPMTVPTVANKLMTIPTIAKAIRIGSPVLLVLGVLSLAYTNITAAPFTPTSDELGYCISNEEHPEVNCTLEKLEELHKRLVKAEKEYSECRLEQLKYRASSSDYPNIAWIDEMFPASNCIENAYTDELIRIPFTQWHYVEVNLSDFKKEWADDTKVMRLLSEYFDTSGQRREEIGYSIAKLSDGYEYDDVFEYLDGYKPEPIIDTRKFEENRRIILKKIKAYNSITGIRSTDVINEISALNPSNSSLTILNNYLSKYDNFIADAKEKRENVEKVKAHDLAKAFMSINNLSRDSAKLQDSVLSVLARPSITGGLILATPTPNRAVYNMELTEKLLRTLK